MERPPFEDSNALRLLVVEDDEQLCTGLKMYLESNDYAVDTAMDGDEGLERACSLPEYALVILDANLPGLSGFDILREMHNKGVNSPVLMLTGMGSHDDKMRGFELGADDYLTKPFSTEELLARVKAIAQRTERDPEELDGEGVFLVGGLQIDLGANSVTRDDEEVKLTDLEYRLFRYLLFHRGRTVSREQLLRHVWHLPSEVETRTIDRHVNALRKVMDGEDDNTWPIQSVYGIGYKLVGVKRLDAPDTKDASDAPDANTAADASDTANPSDAPERQTMSGNGSTQQVPAS